MEQQARAARKAAIKATVAAVATFDYETRLFETRERVNRLVVDQIPKYEHLADIKGRVFCVSVAFSPTTKTCTATVWFELQNGTPLSKERDTARILIAHMVAIAISTVFFKQSTKTLPDAAAIKVAAERSTDIEKTQTTIDNKLANVAKLNAEIDDLQAKIDAFAEINYRLYKNQASYGKRPTEQDKNENKNRVDLIRRKRGQIKNEKYRMKEIQCKLKRLATLQTKETTVLYENSFFELANEDPSNIATLVSQTSVVPTRVSIVNFPGPLVASSSSPANTQIRVRLSESDSSLATTVLSNALSEPDDPDKTKLISTYVIASLLQLMYGYGIGYIGRIEMASKDVMTVRTKICIALNNELNGPSLDICREDGTRWTKSEFEKFTLNSMTTGELEKADSVVHNVLERVAIAIVVDSVDQEILTADTMKYLFTHQTYPGNSYIESHIVGKRINYNIRSGTSAADFLQWAQSVVNTDTRFQRILIGFLDKDTGIEVEVYRKLVNRRRNITFPDAQRLYIKFALGVETSITDALVDQMLADTDNTRFDGLRAYRTRLLTQRADAREVAKIAREADRQPRLDGPSGPSVSGLGSDSDSN